MIIRLKTGLGIATRAGSNILVITTTAGVVIRFVDTFSALGEIQAALVLQIEN